MIKERFNAKWAKFKVANSNCNLYTEKGQPNDR